MDTELVGGPSQKLWELRYDWTKTGAGRTGLEQKRDSSNGRWQRLGPTFTLIRPRRALGPVGHRAVTSKSYLSSRYERLNTRIGGMAIRCKIRVLTHRKENYEVNLEEGTTSAETLDWIFQIPAKIPWAHCPLGFWDHKKRCRLCCNPRSTGL
jgi:hypothetical protein